MGIEEQTSCPKFIQCNYGLTWDSSACTC